MDNWKKALEVGKRVCLNNYGGKPGVRFGVVEDCNYTDFLVKMQLDENEDPIHYDKGYYRRYKYDKILANGIVVI